MQIENQREQRAVYDFLISSNSSVKKLAIALFVVLFVGTIIAQGISPQLAAMTGPIVIVMTLSIVLLPLLLFLSSWLPIFRRRIRFEDDLVTVSKGTGAVLYKGPAEEVGSELFLSRCSGSKHGGAKYQALLLLDFPNSRRFTIGRAGRDIRPCEASRPVSKWLWPNYVLGDVEWRELLRGLRHPVDGPIVSTGPSVMLGEPQLWVPQSRVLSLLGRQDFPKGVVYCGCERDEAFIRAVGLEGKTLWKHPMMPSDFKEKSYYWREGEVYFCGPDGAVRLVDPATGTERWRTPLTSPLKEQLRLHPSEGLLALTADQRVTVLDPATGEATQPKDYEALERAHCSIPSPDSPCGTVACGATVIRSADELMILDHDEDGDARRVEGNFSVDDFISVEPASMVRGATFSKENIEETYIVDDEEETVIIPTLTVKGWSLGYYCTYVADKLLCFGASDEYYEDGSNDLALFVFNLERLVLENLIPLGKGLDSVRFAYLLDNRHVCLGIVLKGEGEELTTEIVDFVAGKLRLKVQENGAMQLFGRGYEKSLRL